MVAGQNIGGARREFSIKRRSRRLIFFLHRFVGIGVCKIFSPKAPQYRIVIIGTLRRGGHWGQQRSYGQQRPALRRLRKSWC
jgi:hypothetical protein